MKNVILVLAALFVVAMGEAMPFPMSTPNITIDGRLNCPYISYNGGTAYLQIAITTSGAVRRRPMNISVVLDRSGSMGDEGKMEYAKSALGALIDQLQSEDIFSLVVYDDDVDVLREAGRVGNKNGIKRLIEGIYPRGSTNLGDGLVEGLRQVECNVSEDYVNRVILLSDGLANRGETDPSELNRIARRYRSKSVSVTTMGVGLAYNENLMVGLSESGGGNYYFIESSHGLTAMLQKEFNSLSSVLAQNASLELNLGRGVAVRDVIGCEHRSDGGKYVIQLGDLYSNEQREITVELDVPEGSGSLVVARGALRFERGRVGGTQSFSATVHYTRDVATIEKNRDMKTQAKADIAVSTRRVDHAMQLLDAGKKEEAAVELKEARQAVMASPAAATPGFAAGAISAQEDQLKEFSAELDKNKDNVARAKKSIQYNNYRAQKKK